MNRTVSIGVVLVLSSLAACSSAPKVESAPAPAAPPARTAPTPSPVAAAPPAASARPAAAAAFHPSRIVAARDSFDVFVGGQSLGYSISQVSLEGANYHVTTKNVIPMARVGQSENVLFDAKSMALVSYTSDGTMQGMPLNSSVIVTGGQAKGTAMDMGPTGMKTVSVDMPVPAGVISDDALLALIPTLDLSENFTMSFKTFDASPGEILPTDLTVAGRETVTVPAGTFETWRVNVQQKNPSVMFVTIAAPHRIVLARVEGGQVELRLTK